MAKRKESHRRGELKNAEFSARKPIPTRYSGEDRSGFSPDSLFGAWLDIKISRTPVMRTDTLNTKLTFL